MTSRRRRRSWARPECAWITGELEQRSRHEAIAHIVPQHVSEVRDRRLAWIRKTRAAVQERLTRESAYWDSRAGQLRLEEQAGKAGARLNSGEASRRADDLQERLRRRMARLDAEEQISALPPAVIGGLVVAPAGLLARHERTARRRGRRWIPRPWRPGRGPSSWRWSGGWASSRWTASSRGSATTSRAGSPAAAGCASSR